MTPFSRTDEQDALATATRQFLATVSAESDVRRLMTTTSGYDAMVWRRFATEIGAVGLAVPEEFGGLGLGPVEIAILMEELGRSLSGLPFLSTAVLGVRALLASDDPAARARILPAIASGECITALAFPGESGRWDSAGVSVRAEDGPGASTRLTGTAPWTIDGGTADILFVPAVTRSGIAVFLVEADAAGLARAPLTTLDETRRLAAVIFEETPATRLEGDGADILEAVLAAGASALAAEQSGAAQAALEQSLAYLRSRVQFGQPIGAFQALAHMAVDVHVEVESALSASRYAAHALATAGEDAAAAVSLAQAYCTDALVFAAHQNIQFHGGTGFTWEMPAHLVYKRARADEILFGDAAQHRARLIEQVLRAADAPVA